MEVLGLEAEVLRLRGGTGMGWGEWHDEWCVLVCSWEVRGDGGAFVVELGFGCDVGLALWRLAEKLWFGSGGGRGQVFGIFWGQTLTDLGKTGPAYSGWLRGRMPGRGWGC